MFWTPQQMVSQCHTTNGLEPKDGHITVWALCLKPYQMLQYSQTLNCSYINGSRRGTQTSKHGYLIVF